MGCVGSAPEPFDGTLHVSATHKLDPLKSKYTLGKVLGSGTCATVYEATDNSNGSQVAIKIIDLRTMDEEEIEQFSRECYIQRLLDHPSIVKFKDVYLHKKKIYLIEEEAVGGDMFDFIAANDHLSENAVLRILFKLLSAVEYMHDHGVIHRDLKLENVFLRKLNDENSVLIGDFGNSALVQGKMPAHMMETTSKFEMATVVGTYSYLAPEMVTNQNSQSPTQDSHYSMKVDEWALGVLGFVCLTGIFPFDSDLGDSDMFRKIQNSEPKWPEDIQISSEVKNLIESLLSKQTCDRPTATEVLRLPVFDSVDEPATEVSEVGVTINTSDSPKRRFKEGDSDRLRALSRKMSSMSIESSAIPLAQKGDRKKSFFTVGM